MSDTNQRITDIVGANDVVLFMKGSPDSPRCGFSRQIVELRLGVVQVELARHGLALHRRVEVDERQRARACRWGAADGGGAGGIGWAARPCCSRCARRRCAGRGTSDSGSLAQFMVSALLLRCSLSVVVCVRERDNAAAR